MTKKYQKSVSFLSSLKLWGAVTVNIGMTLCGARSTLYIFHGIHDNLFIFNKVEFLVVPIENSIIECYSTHKVVTKHWNDYVPDSKGYIFLANFESESDTTHDKKCMKSV